MDNLTPREALDICNGSRPATANRKAEAWQYLHDTKLAYNIEGPYAETVRSMIRDGLITTKGTGHGHPDRG